MGCVRESDSAGWTVCGRILIGYNSTIIVEVLSNLIWLVVAVVLIACWLVGLRQKSARSLLPAIGLQLVAVALLAVILLPVISVSDDLQAANTPAEVEHVSRRCDLQPSPDQPLHSLPAALALLVAGMTLPGQQKMEFQAWTEPPVRPVRGHVRALATRPPPAA